MRRTAAVCVLAIVVAAGAIPLALGTVWAGVPEDHCRQQRPAGALDVESPAGWTWMPPGWTCTYTDEIAGTRIELRFGPWLN